MKTEFLIVSDWLPFVFCLSVSLVSITTFALARGACIFVDVLIVEFRKYPILQKYSPLPCVARAAIDPFLARVNPRGAMTTDDNA